MAETFTKAAGRSSAVYELIQVTDRVYYVDCPAKMGLCLLDENRVLLVDSGGDKDAGKKVLKHLEKNGWTLAGVFNTHSHADHIGGNKLIAERTGAPVYAPGVERAFTCWPELEPSFLYGGFPPVALRNKFLQAQPSMAQNTAELELPDGFERIDLSGHSFRMEGLRTPDNVVFLADCLSGENIIEKYHVNFLYDVQGCLATLDRVEEMEADWFIPAHAPACQDIKPLVQANRAKVQEIAQVIERICEEPSTPEQILKAVFDHYDLKMDFNQYVLVGSTVRSYLSWLNGQGKIEAKFEENRLIWQNV